jgi:hypothetical protein
MFRMSENPKKATSEYIKRLAKDILISSKKESLNFYFTKLIPTEIKLDKVKDNIENICDELRTYRYKEDSEEYIHLNNRFLQEHSKEVNLEASVKELWETYLKLRDEKKVYLLAFPDLEMIVANKVASHYENEKAKVWYRDIERQREELYNAEITNRYEYEEQRDELKFLSEKEDELDDDLRDYYNYCLDILLADKISTRRSHALTLITPM